MIVFFLQSKKRITGLSTDVNSDDVHRIIEEHMATFPSGDKHVEVAFMVEVLQV